MPTLILLRHGQSVWNQANLFTGWVDVPLSMQGVTEAFDAGEMVADEPIDLIFTSTLMRAQQTAMLTMLKHHSGKVPTMIHDQAELNERAKIYDKQSLENTMPVYIDWRLNERYYGALQGLNKQATREKYGDEQVKIWRRSYDTPPPEGESLAMTAERTLPCLHERIIPYLDEGKNVLIAAHGNSLRSIVMYLENLDKKQVLALELPTGKPRIYEYKNKQFSLR